MIFQFKPQKAMFSDDFFEKIRLIMQEEIGRVVAQNPPPPQKEKETDLLNTKEAAKFLKCSTWLIYTETAKGNLPFVLIGQRKRYKLDDLQAFNNA